MTELNPYKSPIEYPESSQNNTVKVLLRIGAVACWIGALLFVLVLVLMLFEPRAAVAFRRQTYSFAIILPTMFFLPAIALFLLGLAGWRRIFRPLLYGSALLVPPMVMILFRTFFW